MSKTTINMPVPFKGTEIEKLNNRKTHDYIQIDEGEYRCLACDCKPWHKAADYPCGVEPPRQDVTYSDE